jgi:hypothetical protein
VIDGVPVLLRDRANDELGSRLHGAGRELPRQTKFRTSLEPLGVSELEKRMAVELARTRDGMVDPVVSALIAAPARRPSVQRSHAAAVAQRRT